MTDVTDNFNRANGGLGANWTTLSNTAVTTTLTIVSNEVRTVTTANDGASYWNANPFPSDHYAQCKLGTVVGEGGGPIVRAHPTTWYEFFCMTGGANVFDLAYFDGTSWSLLGAAQAHTFVSGDVMRLDATGSTLTPSVNGVAQSTRTDATLTGGSPGLHIYEVAGSSADDFLAGPALNILTASNLTVGSPVVPTLVAMCNVVLDDRVLDVGLAALDTEADKIFVCSQHPTTYAEATSTYALGVKVFSAGAVFGAPASGSPGRSVTSVAVTDGVITANGTVTAWAIVDSANSRLLASGPVTGSKAVTIGQGFTLGAMTLRLPGSLS